MEPEKFVIFSSTNQGWLTAQATYSSDVTEAMEMDHGRALLLCQRHFRRDGSVVNYIPVPTHLIQEITNG